MLRMALELRAPLELAAALAALPLLRLAPRGDGHPVLVLPGLAAGDLSTIIIRRFLTARGYRAHAWEQGLNLGARPGVLEACVARVRQLRAEHGRRVSLVGWSLGGVYAREIAKMLPEEVRVVVTLGAPFSGGPEATNAWRLYQLISGDREIDAARYAALKLRPGVPTTSIFSRSDGESSENIEVHASHMGMGANPMALYAIADRLAQPEGRWRRFDHAGHRGVKKLLFRDPRRAPGLASLFGLY